jgi:hypothetical protein
MNIQIKESNFSVTPSPYNEQQIPKRNQRFKFMILLIVYSALMGMIDAWSAHSLPNGGIHSIIEMLIFIAIVVQLVNIDSKMRNYEIGAFLSTCIVFLSIIAVPYYLIHSRGWTRGIISLLKTIGIMVGVIMVYGIGNTLVEVVFL